MTEETHEKEPRTFGLKKGLWGRLLAIGVFVGLGTFAVSQTMQVKEKSSETEASTNSQTEKIAEDTAAPFVSEPTVVPVKLANQTIAPSPNSPLSDQPSESKQATNIADTKIIAEAKPQIAKPEQFQTGFAQKIEGNNPDFTVDAKSLVQQIQADTALPPAQEKTAAPALPTKIDQPDTFRTNEESNSFAAKPESKSFGDESPQNVMTDNPSPAVDAALPTPLLSGLQTPKPASLESKSFEASAQEPAQSINAKPKSNFELNELRPLAAMREPNENPKQTNETPVMLPDPKVQVPDANPLAEQFSAGPRSSQPAQPTPIPKQPTFGAEPPVGMLRREPQPSPQRQEPLPSLPTASLAPNNMLNASNGNTQPTPGDAKLEGLQTPSLAIEKIAPTEIQVNQVAKFKIAVRNVGTVNASEVMVSDQIPAGTEFIGSEPQVTRKTPDGKIFWLLGDLPSGAEKIISLDLRPTQPGEIGSVAQVSFASQASMRTRVTRPLLDVEHSSTDRSLVGSPVQLKILVHNRGDGEAKDVMLHESVPQQLKYSSDDFRELEYPIGTIRPGQTKEISLNLSAAEAGRFKNTVVVTAAGDLKASHSIDMEVVSPLLSVVSSGPTRRFLKREAVYEFTTSNNGTASASNVDLIARLPRGLKFDSADNLAEYNPDTHAVYWALDELKPGQQAKVSLTATPVETGQADFDFQVTGDLDIAATAHQPLTIEHLVDVYFEIDDVEDHIEVGSPTQYIIKVVNQGTKPASNVRLSLELENGVQPMAVDSAVNAEIRGQAVVFAPIANINPGEELKIVVDAIGRTPGEHRVSANLQTDGREINISKEESTRVYADR